MTKHFLFLLMLTLELSCNSCRQKSNSKQIFIGVEETEIKSKENIQFDFTAERINTFKETIEIKATLYNKNVDTVYFLSSSCNGEQYSLRYDTTQFVLTPFLNCNTSYPRLIKIAPKGRHNFQTHFRCSSNETKIKLGFDFYSVDKSFDLENKNFGDINIFNRPKDKQTILREVEKTIK